MNRFIAIFNEGTHCNIAATRMEIHDNAIHVYNGIELVGFFDTSAILYAHMSNKTKEDYK